MQRSEVRADHIEENLYDSGGGTWSQISSPFDGETGKPRMGVVLRCPLYYEKRRWFETSRNHDVLAVFEGRVYWGIRLRI